MGSESRLHRRSAQRSYLFAKRHDRWVTIIRIDVIISNRSTTRSDITSGMKCLKIIAQRNNRSCVKEEDTVVRLGEDEFVVLLVNQPKKYQSDNNCFAAIAAKLFTASMHRGSASMGHQQHRRRRLSRRWHKRPHVAWSLAKQQCVAPRRSAEIISNFGRTPRNKHCHQRKFPA